MAKDLIKKVEDFAKMYCKKDPQDKRLWEDHVQLVRKFSLKLADIEKADRLVVEISALLHDIGKCYGRKDHNIRSYELSKEFLKNLDLPENKKELILKCILKHSSEFSKEDNEIEVKVVQSGDALGTLFDLGWQDYTRDNVDKKEVEMLLNKSLIKINLESARKIALPQIDKLKKLLV